MLCSNTELNIRNLLSAVRHLDSEKAIDTAVLADGHTATCRLFNKQLGYLVHSSRCTVVGVSAQMHVSLSCLLSDRHCHKQRVITKKNSFILACFCFPVSSSCVHLCNLLLASNTRTRGNIYKLGSCPAVHVFLTSLGSPV